MGPHKPDLLTPGSPRCVHHEWTFVQVLISTVSTRHLGGSCCLRNKSTECSGDWSPQPSCVCSSPHLRTFAEPVCGHITTSLHCSLSPANAAPPSSAWSPPILATPPAKLATAFSPGFRLAPQPTNLTASFQAKQLCSEATFQEFLPYAGSSCLLTHSLTRPHIRLEGDTQKSRTVDAKTQLSPQRWENQILLSQI